MYQLVKDKTDPPNQINTGSCLLHLIYETSLNNLCSKNSTLRFLRTKIKLNFKNSIQYHRAMKFIQRKKFLSM